MINLISTFVAVVDAGSFSEAGRRLDQPKSAVSRRIEQLEQRLGSRLLQRSTRAVQPTEVGREYYKRCVRILAEIEEAEQLVRRDQATPSGKLRVQLPIELGMHVLGRLMVEFARETPDLSLQLELSSHHVDIIEEQYDLAIRIGAMPDSSLVSRKILSIKRGIYASSRYLAQYGEPQTLDELQRHSCLRFHTDYQSGDWVLTGATGPVTFRPAGSVVANNLTVLREAAVCGLGIAVLPCLMCRAAIESGQLRPVMQAWVPDDAEVFVLYPSRAHLSMKVRGFLAFLDRRLDKLSSWINAPIERLSPPDIDGSGARLDSERSVHGEPVARLQVRSAGK
jgi:DNA-binding transcriptional LysR family regulator